jgi:hypothetical protein
VAGVPLIVGVAGAVPVTTWMLNGARDAPTLPLLTLITMFVNVPTSELEGVPLRVPVEVLKRAQDGWF